MLKNMILDKGLEDLRKKVEKKYRKREQKKRRRFRVSGKSIFELKDLMRKD